MGQLFVSFLFLYILAAASTNIGLFHQLTIAEGVFPVLLILLLANTHHLPFFRHPKHLNLADLLVAWYIIAGFITYRFAICDVALERAYSGLYFGMVYITGKVVVTYYKPQTEKIILRGLSIATTTGTFAAGAGMIWSVLNQKNALTAWFYKDYPYFGDMARATGFFTTPTLFAFILGTSILIKTAHLSILRNNTLLKFLLLADIAGLLMTSSKVILAATAGVIYILFLKGFVSRIWQRISLLLLTLLLFLSTHFLIIHAGEKNALNSKVSGDLLLQINDYQIYTSSYAILKKGSWEAIKAYFPGGIGSGCHVSYTTTLIKSGVIPQEIGGGNPHSIYSGLVAEQGLMGLMFLTGLIYYLFTILRKIQFLKNNQSNELILFLPAFFLMFMIEGICSDLLTFRLFWFFLGIYSGLVMQAQNANRNTM